MTDYIRADYAPIRDTVYGIGFHWTTWTLPKEGEPVGFEEAVETFDVDRFVQQAVDTGAGHVLFTSTHQLHWLPAPNPEVDKLISGRTCRRDLLMEIADGLGKADIKLILYYHHGTDGANQDPEWWEASGAGKSDQTEFYNNYCNILQWMGEHYGPKVIAYWFDAAYGLMKRGEVPWERMLEASKAGHSGRLITYNAGIELHDMYTPLQDYWAGEVCRLNFRPKGLLTCEGLPWHSFTAWHASYIYPGCGEWGIDHNTRGEEWTPPPVEYVAEYLRHFRECKGAVTFALLCYQDGSVYDADLQRMKELKKLVRK